MSKCACCNKKVTIVNKMECKWCKMLLCIGCLGVEVHKCNSMQECKQAALNKLTYVLEKNKTNDTKYIHI